MQPNIQPTACSQSQYSWRILAYILLFALTVGTLLIGNQRFAWAGESNHTGIVTSMPASGLVGNWVVGGVSFVATGSTEFREDKGALAVGVCAEVEYVGGTQPFTATKIASKNSDDCSSAVTPTTTGTSTATATAPTGTSTATATAPTGTPVSTPSVTPDTTPAPGTEREVYGRVEQMPSPGLVGNWVVNGVSYRTTSSTEFDQRNGPFVIGACVKLHYSVNNNPFPIREMRTEEASDCTGNSATPVATPNVTVTSTPNGEREIYGLVESMPGNRVGNWVINGVTYVATASTEFKEEHGAFAVGSCVKLHAQSNTMREIETEQAYRCSGNSGGGNDDGSGDAELYGILQSFPAGLIGNWNVGGTTFVADSATEFKQQAGVFTVGMTVKVHFSTDNNGTHRAREIESRYANDDNGSDDDGNGSFEGAEGHAYGTIDSIAANTTGTWRIGGIEYSITSNTILAENDGPLVVGKQVKVEYRLDTNGGRSARKIESTSETGGVTDPTRFKFFGFVDQMPAGGFIGIWVVDTVTFTTVSNSQFKENNGVFALGSYVAVEYTVQDGTNIVHEIESHIPPGAGPNLTTGRIDDKGGQVNAAAQPAATWVIGGQSYTINPATDLNDFTGSLNVGDTAVVNSYTDGAGNRIATQVRGIVLDQQRYLPLIVR